MSLHNPDTELKLPTPFNQTSQYKINHNHFLKMIDKIHFFKKTYNKHRFWQGEWLSDFPSSIDKHLESKPCSDIYKESMINTEILIVEVIRSLFPKLENLNISGRYLNYNVSSVGKWIYFEYINYCKKEFVTSYSSAVQKPIRYTDVGFEVMGTIKKQDIDYSKNMERMHDKSITFLQKAENTTVGALLESLLMRVIRTVNKELGKIILRKITSVKDIESYSVCSQEMEGKNDNELIFTFSHPVGWYIIDHANDLGIEVIEDQVVIDLMELSDYDKDINLYHLTIYSASILEKMLNLNNQTILYPNWLANSEQLSNIQGTHGILPELSSQPLMSVHDGYFIAHLPIVMIIQNNQMSMSQFIYSTEKIVKASVDIRSDSLLCTKCKSVLQELVFRCLGKGLERYRDMMCAKLYELCECVSIIRGHMLTIDVRDAKIEDDDGRNIFLTAGLVKFLNPTKLVLLCTSPTSLLTLHSHGKFKGIGLFSNAVTLFHPLTMYSNIIVSMNNDTDIKMYAQEVEYPIMSKETILQSAESLELSSPLLQSLLLGEDVELTFDYLVNNYITFLVDPLILNKRNCLMDMIKTKINEKLQLHTSASYADYKKQLYDYFRTALSNNGTIKQHDYGQSYKLWEMHCSKISSNDIDGLCALFTDQFTTDINSLIWRRTCRYIPRKPFCSGCKKNYDYQLPVEMCELVCSAKKAKAPINIRSGIGTLSKSPKLFC